MTFNPKFTTKAKPLDIPGLENLIRFSCMAEEITIDTTKDIESELSRYDHLISPSYLKAAFEWAMTPAEAAPKTSKPASKPAWAAAEKPCPKCGSYCDGDCEAANY